MQKLLLSIAVLLVLRLVQEQTLAQDVDRYTKEFTEYVIQAALAALKDRKPGKLAWGQASARFGANRRTKGGPVDHDAPVLVAATGMTVTGACPFALSTSAATSGGSGILMLKAC